MITTTSPAANRDGGVGGESVQSFDEERRERGNNSTLRHNNRMASMAIESSIPSREGTREAAADRPEWFALQPASTKGINSKS